MFVEVTFVSAEDWLVSFTSMSLGVLVRQPNLGKLRKNVPLLFAHWRHILSHNLHDGFPVQGTGSMKVTDRFDGLSCRCVTSIRKNDICQREVRYERYG